MSIIVFIALGGMIGWLAARLMGRREGAIGSTLIGIIGSFIGSFIARLFNSSSYLSVSWAGVIWSLIGAIILVAIINAAGRSRHHTVKR